MIILSTNVLSLNSNWPQILAFHTNPVLVTLAPTIANAPTINKLAENICMSKYLPPFAVIRAPAIGDPVSTAKLLIVYPIPILVPIFDKSDVKLASAAGYSPVTAELNSP